MFTRAAQAATSAKPVFISVGHRVSLDTAVALTRLVSKSRIPEPIRAADLRSRDLLREAEDRKKQAMEAATPAS